MDLPQSNTELSIRLVALSFVIGPFVGLAAALWLRYRVAKPRHWLVWGSSAILLASLLTIIVSPWSLTGTVPDHALGALTVTSLWTSAFLAVLRWRWLWLRVLGLVSAAGFVVLCWTINGYVIVLFLTLGAEATEMTTTDGACRLRPHGVAFMDTEVEILRRPWFAPFLEYTDRSWVIRDGSDWGKPMAEVCSATVS